MNVMQVMPYQHIDRGAKSKTGINKQTSKPDLQSTGLKSIKIDLKEIDNQGTTSESDDLTPLSNFGNAFEGA
jgi:hypothetical protein